MNLREASIPFAGKNLQVHYRERGEGPLVLLVHGWLHSSLRWEATLSALPEGHHYLAPDLPGFGATPPLPLAAQAIERYAAWLSAFRKGLDLPAPHALIGDSMGALVLLTAVANEKLTARGLLLTGCPNEGLPTWMIPLSLQGLIRGELTAGRITPAQLVSFLVKRNSFLTVNNRRMADDILVEDALAADPVSAEQLFRAILHFRFDPAKHPLPKGMKVRLLRGAQDRVISRSANLRLAQSWSVPYEEIPASGHSPMIEQPELLVRSIRRFLTALP